MSWCAYHGCPSESCNGPHSVVKDWLAIEKKIYDRGYVDGLKDCLEFAKFGNHWTDISKSIEKRIEEVQK